MNSQYILKQTNKQKGDRTISPQLRNEKKTHFEKERLVGITGFLRKTDPRKKKTRTYRRAHMYTQTHIQNHPSLLPSRRLENQNKKFEHSLKSRAPQQGKTRLPCRHFDLCACCKEVNGLKN